MIKQPRRGLRVLFKPPENAYSRFSRQAQVSGLDGVLEDWNGFQAKVRFFLFGKNASVNGNVDYIYDENGTGDFKASDFEIVGDIAEPVTTIRPKLL